MSDLNKFLKENKEIKKNVKYKASKYFKDEDGNILEWEIKPISSKRNDDLRNECMVNVPVSGKRNSYKQNLDTAKYTTKLVVESIVYPNLNDKKLQDSYGVMCAEDLIRELIDEPGEYDDLVTFITEFNGYNKSFDEDIEEAKN